MRLLPAGERRALLAIYGFARLADALGDEAPGDRLAHLDALEGELDRAYAGTPRHPLLQRLALVLRERELPRRAFVRLIDANRRDQRGVRVADAEELLDYCRLSANPVGELVLHVFAAVSRENVADSDAICSALQIVEHLQDVREDWQRGRIYLPAEELARFGVAETELGVAPASPALRRAVAHRAAHARRLLRVGAPLLARLRGRARVAVAGFAAGGHAALDALERADFDVTTATRRPRRRDVLRHIARELRRSTA